MDDPGRIFQTEDEFVSGIVKTFKVEKAKWLALSPEQQLEYLQTLTPAEQHWIEHGGEMPPMSSGIEV